MLQIQIRGHP